MWHHVSREGKASLTECSAVAGLIDQTGSSAELQVFYMTLVCTLAARETCHGQESATVLQRNILSLHIPPIIEAHCYQFQVRMCATA